MLDLGLDDDMLANVLGHEIGHVINEHSIKMQRKATLMSILGNLLVAASSSASRSAGRTVPNNAYDPRVAMATTTAATWCRAPRRPAWW